MWKEGAYSSANISNSPRDSERELPQQLKPSWLEDWRPEVPVRHCNCVVIASSIVGYRSRWRRLMLVCHQSSRCYSPYLDGLV